MRTQIALIALLVLAACGQQSEQKADQPPPAQAEDVIRSRNASHWVVREGQFANDAFTLQASGMAFVQNAREPVVAGDAYTGEIVVAADNTALVTVRVSNGCGTAENDQGAADYNVQPGENTLRVNHTFVRSAECARLSITSRGPLTYKLTSARLERENAS